MSQSLQSPHPTIPWGGRESLSHQEVQELSFPAEDHVSRCWSHSCQPDPVKGSHRLGKVTAFVRC